MVILHIVFNYYCNAISIKWQVIQQHSKIIGEETENSNKSRT